MGQRKDGGVSRAGIPFIIKRRPCQCNCKRFSLFHKIILPEFFPSVRVHCFEGGHPLFAPPQQADTRSATFPGVPSAVAAALVADIASGAEPRLR
jgi:hypothetical protein